MHGSHCPIGNDLRKERVFLQQVVIFYSNPVVQECADAYYRAFQHLGIDTLRVDTHNYHQYENKVDLVLVMWGYEFLEEHFNYYPNAKIALLLMDEPYEVDHTQHISHNYDMVLNYEPNTLSYHQNCYYLPFAYDSLGLRDIAQDIAPPEFDVCFWGSAFPPRTQLLEELQHRSTLQTTIQLGKSLKERQPYHAYYTTAKQARINLNIHRQPANRDYPHCSNHDHVPATGLNMRFWNLAGIGAFQLNYANREELHRFPQVDTFTSAHELIQKIDYFLEHDQERHTLTQALQHEILAKHTYIHRVQEIVRLVEQNKPSQLRCLDRSAFALIHQIFAQYSDEEIPA